MKPDLYQRVALRRDFPEHRLRSCDVATLIDRATHAAGGEDRVILEVFDALGRSIAVVAVPESAVGPLGEVEIPAFRKPAGAP